MKQKLDDRMKSYEMSYRQALLPNAYFVVRLDGRGFSKFTKKMQFIKPFDEYFLSAMKETARKIMERNNATITYTQSDEISLVFQPKHMNFGGRIDKLCSTLAAFASVVFSQELKKQLPEKTELIDNLIPTFDCRVFSVPSADEAFNALLWREQDAVKNSILSLAQSNFSQKQMHGLNCKKLQEKLLIEKDTNWNDLPRYLKRGTYFTRFSSIKTNPEGIEYLRSEIREDENFVSILDLIQARCAFDYFFEN